MNVHLFQLKTHTVRNNASQKNITRTICEENIWHTQNMQKQTYNKGNNVSKSEHHTEICKREFQIVIVG